MKQLTFLLCLVLEKYQEKKKSQRRQLTFFFGLCLVLENFEEKKSIIKNYSPKFK